MCLRSFCALEKVQISTKKYPKEYAFTNHRSAFLLATQYCRQLLQLRNKIPDKVYFL